MVKHRHLLYRKWKPPKQRDKFIPKFFQMGRVVEGPAEYYSARLPRKERRNTWAKEFLANADTKEWIRLKTERALSRDRRAGNRVWTPVKQFSRNSRYNLRKKVQKVKKIKRRLKQTSK